jgi:hypothetical protein
MPLDRDVISRGVGVRSYAAAPLEDRQCSATTTIREACSRTWSVSVRRTRLDELRLLLPPCFPRERGAPVAMDCRAKVLF